VYLPLICEEPILFVVEGSRLQTALVKKPEDWEILDLLDVECTYPEAWSSECTAPPSCRCPYRRYKRSLPAARVAYPDTGESGRTYDIEMFSLKSESGLSHSPPLRLTSKRS
jgi:hypothetical protein